MEDIVLAHRSLTLRDLTLWSLIAQLTPDEVEEAIQLVRDMMEDRGQPYPVTRSDSAPAERPVVAD